MIEKINIAEFRGIRECAEDIKFSKFNVFVGRNNSGKTTVLEAIYLLGLSEGIIRYGNTIYTLYWLHSGKANSLIYGYSGNAKIDYTLNNKKLRLVIDERGCFEMRDMDTGDSIPKYKLLELLEIITKDDTAGKNSVKNLEDAFIFIPNNSQYIEILIAKIKDEKYEKIIKGGAHVKIVELINKCINDKFTDIYLPDFKLRKELSDNILYIPVKDLGAGLVKTIPVLLWIETFQPIFLLWDDFEFAHPTLIKILMEYLSKKDIQIFISTHSIDVLSALVDIKPKDTSVLLLSKTSDDVLKYSKLNLEELEIMMEDGHHDPRIMCDALQL